LVTVNSSNNTATGNITYQVWNNIGGNTAVSELTNNSNYPNSPSYSSILTSLEAPLNTADNYGSRIAGYIYAPATGSYTFWISGDDNCELWLSTDNQAANKQKIAYHTSWTYSREWNKFTTQKSAFINLVQGQSYYVEALLKEAGGYDNLAVGWLKPGQTGTVPSEVVPGSVLSQIGTKSIEKTVENPVLSNLDFKLLVYPNPLNSDILNIKVDNLLNDAILKIYTISGILIREELIHSTETILIDRSVFKSGIYFIRVFNNEFDKNTKLIVR
jgi:xyloglucan-specific exo-beta-1,4-glucanase